MKVRINETIAGDYGVKYKRISKHAAEEVFNSGKPVYLMTADRNPVNSLTSEIKYQQGEKMLFYYYKEARCFSDVLEDFSDWLDNDGYGHMPDHTSAKYYRFSYWIITKK